MKKLFTIALTVGLLGASACDPNEFLDREIPRADREFGKPESLEDMELDLFGTYWQFSVGSLEKYWRQAISHYFIHNELLSDEMTVTDPAPFFYLENGEESFNPVYNRQLDHTLFERESFDWTYIDCYSALSSINPSIQLVENPTSQLLLDIEDRPEDFASVAGELYTLRGYIYFLLAQMFGPKYQPGGDNSAESLIVRTENTAEFAGVFATPNSVQEVYDRIIADLQAGTAYMPYEKRGGRFSKGSAHALLARVYLDMNEWELCKLHCDSAIMGPYSFEADPFLAFARTDGSYSNECLWEINYSQGHQQTGPNRHDDFVSENAPALLSLWNWIERITMGRREYFGASFTVDRIGMRAYALSHSIMQQVGWLDGGLNVTTEAQNDLRFQELYHYAPGDTDTRMAPVVAEIPQQPYVWVFKDARSELDAARDGDNLDVANYDGRAHLPIIRLGEVYLTRAIANLRMGNQAAALDDLNTVKEARWDTNAGPFTPFNGADVEQEIENERIKELAGEGDRLFYLKAMQYPVPPGDRDGGATITYPYDELFWDLPPSEVDANPNASN